MPVLQLDPLTSEGLQEFGNLLKPSAVLHVFLATPGGALTSQKDPDREDLPTTGGAATATAALR